MSFFFSQPVMSILLKFCNFFTMYFSPSYTYHVELSFDCLEIDLELLKKFLGLSRTWVNLCFLYDWCRKVMVSKKFTCCRRYAGSLKSLEHMINYSLIEFGTIQMCCSSLQTIQHLSLCFTLSNLILKHLMNHVCSTLKLFLIATLSQHHFACEMWHLRNIIRRDILWCLWLLVVLNLIKTLSLFMRFHKIWVRKLHVFMIHILYLANTNKAAKHQILPLVMPRTWQKKKLLTSLLHFLRLLQMGIEAITFHPRSKLFDSQANVMVWWLLSLL